MLWIYPWHCTWSIFEHIFYCLTSLMLLAWNYAFVNGHCHTIDTATPWTLPHHRHCHTMDTYTPWTRTHVRVHQLRMSVCIHIHFCSNWGCWLKVLICVECVYKCSLKRVTYPPYTFPWSVFWWRLIGGIGAMQYCGTYSRTPYSEHTEERCWTHFMSCFCAQQPPKSKHLTNRDTFPVPRVSGLGQFHCWIRS